MIAPTQLKPPVIVRRGTVLIKEILASQEEYLIGNYNNLPISLSFAAALTNDDVRNDSCARRRDVGLAL